ncbi:MAG: MFS transporter [Thermodesulfobacteriota bacterium]|nr:MFS transporter [Thermodesulfobacteriota bacterium]
MAVKTYKNSSFIPSSHGGIFAILFFTIFVIVTGVGMVVPLLPVYAHDLGAGGLYVGMIFGAFALSRTIFLPYFGKLSDKKGRKPFIVAGLAGYALVSVAFIVFPTINSLIIIRFIQGIASAMIMPVVQAYVGEITQKGKEGYSMGLFNMSMFGSLSLGPLLGGVIKDALSMDWTFVCMGVLSVAGLLLAVFFLPPVSKEVLKTKERLSFSFSSIIKDRDLFAIFAFRFGYTSCIGVIWCFLPLFADIEFSLSGTSTGFLVMLGVFVSGILHLPMGYFADRFNKSIMVGVGGSVCILGMFMLTTSDSYGDLIAAVSVFGLGGGISMPAIMAMAVIKGNETGAMALVMSIVTVAHSFGMMTGAMVAGLAMDYFELHFAFPCGMVIMALSTLLFMFTNRRWQT